MKNFPRKILNMDFIRFIFFIAFFSLSIGISANDTQKSIDSLATSVDNLSGKEQVDALNNLSTLYLAARNRNQATAAAEKAATLSKSLNYQEGKANALDNQGKIYSSKKDWDNAMDMFTQSLLIRKETGDKIGAAISNNLIGYVLLQRQEVNPALEKFREAQTGMESANYDQGLSEVYSNMGAAYLAKANPEYGTAIEYYQRAQQLQLKQGKYSEAATTALLVADRQFKLKDYENAMNTLGRAMEIFQGLGDPKNIALVYHKMGEAQRLQKYHEDANDFYDRALQGRKAINDLLGVAQTQYAIALNSLSLGDRSAAESNLVAAGNLLEQIPVQEGKPVLLQGISDTYEKLGNASQALAFQKRFSLSRDSLFNVEKSTAMLEMVTKIESQYQTQQLKTENEKLLLSQKNGRMMRIFLTLLSALALALVWMFYRSNKRKKKDNDLLQKKNEEINTKNEEIEHKNVELDGLNHKLVEEMAERESIEKSSFARDHFLATMSNEMRTPLNIIRGLSNLLLTQEPREDQVEPLRTLQFSANNLVVFINDVLDFSKIEAGKISFDSMPFNPKNIFEEVKDRFKLPAKDKNISLEFSYDEKVPAKLEGDPTRLNQIITNLINTSLKHADKGTMSLRVDVHELVKNKMTLLVTMKDQGQGIDAQKLETMFQRFSRTAEDMYDDYGNSGLGPAIAKRLVELQNGRIEAKSVPGEGTEFKIFLPYSLVDEKRAADNGQAEPKTYEELANKKILVVEDNRINQLVVAKMLRKLGVEVITADNGQEALKEMEEAYFDLILMDIQMPIMDGYRTTAEIRKSQDPRVRDIPIIALTASAYLSEKEKARLFGMNDHVGKPFGPEDLLDKIHYHIIEAVNVS